MAPLSQLTELSTFFLNDCSSLQAVDCRPLRSVTTIERYFLGGCTALQELHVSSFATVTYIGYRLLHNCAALRIFDLSVMTNVTELHAYDLLGDHQLESLVRPETGELATATIAGF